MNHLITQYPVTQDYLERLSELIGELVKPVVVSTLTTRGYLSLLQHFRSLVSESVYIPVIDPSAQMLLPPLQVLSIFVRVRQRYIVDPDFSIRPFGLSTAFLGAFRMAWGIVDGVLIVVRDWVRLGAVELALDSLRRHLQGLPIKERIDFEKNRPGL